MPSGYAIALSKLRLSPLAGLRLGEGTGALSSPWPLASPWQPRSFGAPLSFGACGPQPPYYGARDPRTPNRAASVRGLWPHRPARADCVTCATVRTARRLAVEAALSLPGAASGTPGITVDTYLVLNEVGIHDP